MPDAVADRSPQPLCVQRGYRVDGERLHQSLVHACFRADITVTISANTTTDTVRGRT